MLIDQFRCDCSRFELCIGQSKSDRPCHFFAECPTFTSMNDGFSARQPFCACDRGYRAASLDPGRGISTQPLAGNRQPCGRTENATKRIVIPMKITEPRSRMWEAHYHSHSIVPGGFEVMS